MTTGRVSAAGEIFILMKNSSILVTNYHYTYIVYKIIDFGTYVPTLVLQGFFLVFPVKKVVLIVVLRDRKLVLIFEIVTNFGIAPIRNTIIRRLWNQ